MKPPRLQHLEDFIILVASVLVYSGIIIARSTKWAFFSEEFQFDLFVIDFRRATWVTLIPVFIYSYCAYLWCPDQGPGQASSKLWRRLTRGVLNWVDKLCLILNMMYATVCFWNLAVQVNRWMVLLF